MVHWLERSPELYEARLTLPAGHDAYVGYIATTPGDDVWRAYIGRAFVPLGMGPRTVMQVAVEQRVTDIMRRGGEGAKSLLDTK